jgi:hypothetical protein
LRSARGAAPSFERQQLRERAERTLAWLVEIVAMHGPFVDIAEAKAPPKGRWIGLINDISRLRVTKPARTRLKAARSFFFAAYARRDLVQVQPIFDMIEAEGHLMWIDRINLEPGGVWTADIVAAIRGAREMLVFCSAHSYGSRDIHREIAAAARFRKPILPILLDDTPMPDNFSYYLSVHQAINLADSDWRTRLRCALDALSQGRRKWRVPGAKTGDNDCPPILVRG